MKWFKKKIGTEENEKLKKGLEKSKQSLFYKLTKAIAGRSKVSDSFLDDLEEILISSDVGVPTTLKIIDRLQERIERDKFIHSEELWALLKQEIVDLLTLSKFDSDEKHFESHQPYVIMVVGINGVGKTTSIGKMGYLFKADGKKVVLGAADTFRAAAIDQLEVWSKRLDVPIIKKEMGSDPSAVVYETLQKSIAEKADVILIDTAGRLHNKVNLMNELSKIRRVMQKLIPEAPHEVILVLDASTGQNAFEQTKQFMKATKVSSLILTKLDGTAKGGVAFGISDQFNIPIRFIGVGEGINDLQPFDPIAFTDSFFQQ